MLSIHYRNFTFRSRHISRGGTGAPDGPARCAVIPLRSTLKRAGINKHHRGLSVVVLGGAETKPPAASGSSVYSTALVSSADPRPPPAHGLSGMVRTFVPLLKRTD